MRLRRKGSRPTRLAGEPAGAAAAGNRVRVPQEVTSGAAPGPSNHTTGICRQNIKRSLEKITRALTLQQYFNNRHTTAAWLSVEDGGIEKVRARGSTERDAAIRKGVSPSAARRKELEGVMR